MPIPQARSALEHSWLIWVALVVQFALVSVSFPVTQLGTQAPLFYIDSPFHWYQIELAKGLAATGRILGYDPYFGAGYVGGVSFNVSAKFPAALSILLWPWLSSTVAYKVYVFGAAVLGPACVPLAARWLRLSRGVALAATVFAIFLWWVSALRWFHTGGLVSFVFASYLALPYAALVIRYLSEPLRWPILLLLGAIGAAGMFLHPLFALLVAPLVLALTLARWQEISPHRLIEIYVVLPLLCLLPNLLWLLPTLKYPNFAGSNVQPYQQAVGISIAWDEALGRITKDARGSRLNIVLWLAVLWSLNVRLDLSLKRLVIGLTLGSVGLILFATLGAALPFVGTLQPNRFSSAAYLYLCIPAGVGTAAVFESLLSKGVRRVAAIASAVLLVGALGFFTREITREISDADIPHWGERPPEVRGIGEKSAWILDWVKKNTTADARVLFETSKARIYDDAHMAGYYALASDREFVGGPYPFMFFAGFWDGYLFGQPIGSLSQRDFADYLNLYNIGWIVAFSEESTQFLDRTPGVSPRERFGPIRTYAVTGPHSFLLEGSGSVSARSFNRIELSQLSGPSIVLKYHYVPGLEATPPAHLEPARIMGDPVPFIRITDPPPRLALQMR